MSEYERMLAGKLYIANDLELNELHAKCFEYMAEFNKLPFDYQQKQNVLKKWFKSTGNNSMIIPPLYCDYGCNVSVGDNFYANMDCIFLDVNEIIIGNRVLLGPRVSIFTAGHPIDKDVRNTGLEYGHKVIIGDDVWIGGNTVINPGVTIGSNVVIGSGSVVTKDIPSDCIAYGNPCRVARKITKNDKDYWTKEMMLYYEDKKINK